MGKSHIGMDQKDQVESSYIGSGDRWKWLRQDNDSEEEETKLWNIQQVKSTKLRFLLV